MSMIVRPVYTPKERDKLFQRLHEAGYKWRQGQSLITHRELRDDMLPCDVHINTDKTCVSYSTEELNGKYKYC